MARVAREKANFADVADVHALPEMFHYWSNKYLRPKLESFGYQHPEHFFEVELAKAYDAKPRSQDNKARFVSVGAGNADAETRIAKGLLASGRMHFELACLDINETMLARGADHAKEHGVSEHIVLLQADFNDWHPQGHYDAVMANQSLHHVVNLEHLFAAISQAIGDDGVFVTSDMIGRNGHMRWPEALEIVHEFWRELPESHRYNHQLKRHEPLYENWDCSVACFEGVRAQDILPLLRTRFGFDTFLAYSNVIDVFVDRGFGHNFDAQSDADCGMIDRIHARDEQEIMNGTIKPTHMLAVMKNDQTVTPRTWKHLTPAFCERSV